VDTERKAGFTRFILQLRILGVAFEVLDIACSYGRKGRKRSAEEDDEERLTTCVLRGDANGTRVVPLATAEGVRRVYGWEDTTTQPRGRVPRREWEDGGR